MKDTKNAKTPGGPGAKARSIERNYPQSTTNDITCQAPILFLNISREIDAVLVNEELHAQAARQLWGRVRELALLASKHAKAAHRARRERAILERGIP